MRLLRVASLDVGSNHTEPTTKEGLIWSDYRAKVLLRDLNGAEIARCGTACLPALIRSFAIGTDL
jgi:hypothetical protein